jgi:hypothetical protein
MARMAGLLQGGAGLLGQQGNNAMIRSIRSSILFIVSGDFFY